MQAHKWEQQLTQKDDAYEFFGGAVNCKHLIAYNCADDDFDMDDGFHGKIQFAISVKGAAFILANSIVMGGQKAGLDLDNDSTASYYKEGRSKFYNSFLHAYAKPFQVSKLVTNPPVLDSATLATNTLKTNLSQYFADATEIGLTDPFNNSSPNLKPAAASPALSVTAKFDLAELGDEFFERVSFIGAMDASNDWTTGWTIWGK